MIQTLSEALEFVFFQRALLVGGTMALLCALMGCFVVLRKEANITHALANISFLGIAVGVLLGIDLSLATLLGCLVGSILIILLQRIPLFSYDSILAIISQISLAAAVVVVSFLSGYRTDLLQYLFGDILAIARDEVWWAIGGGSLLLIFFFSFYRRMLQVIFSIELAKSVGTRVHVIQFLFMLAVGMTIGLSIKVIGVLLLAAFLILPPNTAKLFARNFRQMLFFSAIFGVMGTILGLFASYLLDVPGGAMIVLSLGVFLLFGLLFKAIIRR